MEVAARFVALAHRDLPFPEYSLEFCGIAAATALHDVTILSLFWHRANFHHPVDLPDTKGLCWREGILRCLESVRARARTSLPSSAAPPSPPARPAALLCQPAKNMASQIGLNPRQSSPVPAPRLRSPEPLLVPPSSPEPLLIPSSSPEPLLVPSNSPEPLLVPSSSPEPLLVQSSSPEPLLVPSSSPEPLLVLSSSPERPQEAAPHKCPPVPAPRKCPQVPAPRKCPTVPAPRKCLPEPAPRQRTPEPAPLQRPLVSAPAERPQVPAPAEHPQVP